MGIFGRLPGNAGVVDNEKLEKDDGELLTDEETLEVGFVVLRDTFIFTSLRLIVVDKQVLTGRKSAYLSIPDSRITKFSIKTDGHFDPDAELKIGIGSDPNPLQRTFDK